MKEFKKLPISIAPNPHELVRYLIKNEKYVALLESGSGGFPERSRYTIVGWGAKDKGTLIGFENTLEAYLSKFKPNSTFLEGSIAIGYISYEAILHIEQYLRDKAKLHKDWPIAEFFIPENLIIYDNLLNEVYIFGDLPDNIQTTKVSFRTLQKIREVDKRSYIKWVNDALMNIKDGEIFQVVLSRFEEYEYEGDLYDAYIKLAQMNPSPYMYYIMMDGERIILGTSPELLVKVTGNKIETHPIAGTRPRSKNLIEDLKLEDELFNSIKDRAEHIMLVDLARNDLGKVCKYGSVKVRELFVLEKYQSVQHLVSRVDGILEENADIVDALIATFPAGTVTGAPKPRAMELIALYEHEPRGPYAGAIGFIDGLGGEFAITIRSIYAYKNILRIQAGAGIVHDSNPELEYMESEYKLKSLKLSLDMGDAYE